MSTDRQIIEGEAAESDEDQEVTQIMSTNGESVADSPMKVIVEPGEASESDGEYEINTEELTPLEVDPLTAGDTGTVATNKDQTVTQTRKLSDKEKLPLKYDTLLHRKLREKNIDLLRHLTLMKSEMYANGSRNLRNTTQQLIKSQTIIQEVSHNMRLMTNNLFNLEDKIDIISQCNLLPDISPKIPTQRTSTSS
ncbi:uncharacterized protein LOC141899709 [Tubulanus polymorphus]|uniref:uncharacterized protein LOC141899709 n=1 Tax=Tubulanus polymorphus TaxID=672921 RepID=UPI003DA44DC0